MATRSGSGTTRARQKRKPVDWISGNYDETGQAGEGIDMSSWFERSFGYGLGAAIGRAIWGDGGEKGREAAREPIRQQTEEEIRADEKRYDEEARRYEAEDRRGTPAKR